MRELAASLTTRGWSFVAAGGAIVLAAIIVGHNSLARLGVLVLALPLLAAWWVARSRLRLSLTRVVTPQVVTVGQPATVALSVSNEGRAATGLLLLEEQVPHPLGSRPRFVVEGLGSGASRRATYDLRSDVRGRFEVGPMTVRSADPFGLVELGRSFQGTSSLTVTPRVHALPRIPLGGAWTGSGDNRPRAFASGSAEDVTVREYRRGDDLRRVHWRSSARTGELMVRREEQPWQSRATVFLDNRRGAHRGQGAASSLEAALTVAASIAVHLTQLGFSVRVVTASGESSETQWHAHTADASTRPLLEALAVVGPVAHAMPDMQWLAEPGHGGVVVGVFGHLSEPDEAFLRRLQHHAASSLALSIDVDAWAPHLPPSPGRGSTSHLTATGWRSHDLAPHDRIDVAWQQLGLTQTRGARQPQVAP